MVFNGHMALIMISVNSAPHSAIIRAHTNSVVYRLPHSITGSALSLINVWVSKPISWCQPKCQMTAGTEAHEYITRGSTPSFYESLTILKRVSAAGFVSNCSEPSCFEFTLSFCGLFVSGSQLWAEGGVWGGQCQDATYLPTLYWWVIN